MDELGGYISVPAAQFISYPFQHREQKEFTGQFLINQAGIKPAPTCILTCQLNILNERFWTYFDLLGFVATRTHWLDNFEEENIVAFATIVEISIFLYCLYYF